MFALTAAATVALTAVRLQSGVPDDLGHPLLRARLSASRA